MAPIKRNRDSSCANDRTRRRKRPSDTDKLYKCLGKLCGEDCEGNISPVSERSNVRTTYERRHRDRGHRERVHEDLELDAATDYECDEAYDEEPPPPPRAVVDNTHGRSGRVNKHKVRKVPSNSMNDIPFEKGIQVAKGFICEALDFGIQSGYLTPKDTKGKVLRVSSELLQTNEPPPASSTRHNDRHNDRQHDTDSLHSRRIERKRGFRDSSQIEEDSMYRQPMDRPYRRSRPEHNNRRNRSRSGVRGAAGGARRKPVVARSRSRSRVKRKSRKNPPRSESVNPDSDLRARQPKVEDAETEDLGENNPDNNKESTNTSRKDYDNDDSKSAKSSILKTNNEDNQTVNEEKKEESGGEEEGYNDDDNESRK